MILRFLVSFTFWTMVLISLALLTFLAGIILGYVPVQETP